MPEPNKILVKMLDRLLVGLVNGPSMNCRPSASRQRLDLVQLGKLSDLTPENVLRGLLGPAREVTIRARTPMPKGNGERFAKPKKLAVAHAVEAADEHGIPLADGPIDDDAPAEAVSPNRAWLEQQAVLKKLHTIAEDARTYEQDTGVSVLNVGFPLLSLPPGTFGGGKKSATRRVLAPLAFVPVSITVKRGATPAIELACKGEGVDRVMPNTALFAWLEQQTGKTLIEADPDDEGQHPWREVAEIVQAVCGAMNIATPEFFKTPPAPVNRTRVGSAPRTNAPHAEDTPNSVGAEYADCDMGVSPMHDASPRDETPQLNRDAIAPDDAAVTANIGGSPVGSALADAEGAPSLKQHHTPPNAAQASAEADPTGNHEAHGRDARDTGVQQSDASGGDLQLEPAPKADAMGDAPKILCSAVLGLFPMANQGLLRDTQTMIGMGALTGPVESFIRREVSLEIPVIAGGGSPASSLDSSLEVLPKEDPRLQSPTIKGESENSDDSARPKLGAAAAPSAQSRSVIATDERFISGSDPCQARAVRMARECLGLVVHGPPGTGKSQTITNIIGDHLARGQRVLVVCDKRTALDVVFNRLSHMELGSLCALVHDPRRDQRELYRSIRQQLDDLPEATSDARAEAKLAKAERELQSLHDELTNYRDALVRREGSTGEHGATFGELVGHWLELADHEQASPYSDGVELQTLETYANEVADVLRRGCSIDYGVNPWVSAAGLPLGDFLAQPMTRIRATATSCEDAAHSADATIDPAIPPFAPDVPLKQQADARADLLAVLPRLLESTDPLILTRWAKESAENLGNARRKIDAAGAFFKTFDAGPLDAELLAHVGDRTPQFPVAEQLARLAAYQEIAKKWYAFLPLKAKGQARQVINGYGLTLSAESADRVKNFILASRARAELSKLVRDLSRGMGGSPMSSTSKLKDTGGPPVPLTEAETEAGANKAIPSDDVLSNSLKAHGPVIDLMLKVRSGAGFKGIVDRVSEVLARPAIAPALIEGLTKSLPRSTSLEQLEVTTAASRLFDTAWLGNNAARFRAGEPAAEVFTALSARVETLEGVLRVRQGLNVLPAELRSAVERLLSASIEPDRALAILRREALAVEINARLRSDPHLQEIDGQRLATAFSRYRELDQAKRKLTRDVIRHRWISRQQDRLLAQSKSRLNSNGADLRRRLMLRGERALRLRQVIDVGSKAEGGDPLFDFCPIWLCSPETVAQVFPLKPIFDVLVFDEASQMRLEESLPVLVRGKRVVIAGDPKQLPPTRFFESAVAASEDEDVQSDQDLFEQQQGEIEDLLSAALGLDIQQCYLDVHYRSRHADLIAFSNRQFYGSRLQPIPGHPANHRLEASVVLDQVNGIYEGRANEAEADRIVQIVQELFERPEPPSIGIACFNLVQRDLVAEKLDDLAATDVKFAKRLEKARTLQGEGSFEGLFVKNLENVQGDERDYILISTTYGPDRAGRFYRRFGPLGRAGGGRRLNVLVTRAREKVHVVTSVPANAYRSLPELDPGQAPGGTWLLLAYLKYAESVGRESGAESSSGQDAVQPLAASQRVSGSAEIGIEIQTSADGEAPTDHKADSTMGIPPEHGSNSSAGAEAIASANPQAASPDSVSVLPTKSPSVFANALAQRLSRQHKIGSDVYWGNEGFCVDLAMRDPAEPQNITIGVLCDTARFAAADDPIQWDIFRTGILESQGWKLHRVWTPHFFRDPQGVMREVVSSRPCLAVQTSAQAGRP